MCGDHWQCGSVCLGQSLVCPCVATLRRTLITPTPTLRRDTSLAVTQHILYYGTWQDTYYGTRQDKRHSHSNTQQWHIAMQWHKRYGTWQAKRDTYHGTRHKTLDTWYSHHDTQQRHIAYPTVTQEKHIVGYILWVGRIWWKFDFLKIHFSSDFSLEGHLLWYIIY